MTPPWPDDSTTRASAKLRVIHGKDSTILITDGLSDIYSNFNLDKKIKYNGIGAEFYIEFAGRIEFEDVCGHFLVSPFERYDSGGPQPRGFYEFDEA